MPYARSLIASLLAALVAGTGTVAVAQVDMVSRSEASAPPDMSFTAGFAGGRNAIREVEIFTRRQTTPGPAQRVARLSRRTADGPVVEGWAETAGCPALERVVRDMTAMPAVNFAIAGVTPYSDLRLTPGPAADGGFPAEVWGYARQADNAFAHQHVTATAGLLKDWVGLAEDALRPCWNIVSAG